MFRIIIYAILLFLFPLSGRAKVRTVEVKKDQIVQVRTALGVATIIQVPDRPNSLVLGDPSAFKVEYLDQAITIKPLHNNAKSNLYIYTEYRRFNVQLIATSEPSADYVVYLENPKKKMTSSAIGWRNFRNYLKNDPLVFETKRLANTADGVLLVEFEIRSNTRLMFDPEWLWLVQGDILQPIHSIALSHQEIGPKRPIQGVVQILKRDVSPQEPLRIEMRRKKISYLTIPSGVAWK
jgi:hypothetical protein